MDRSNKDASFTAGAATMVGLRLFEPLLQYRLLTDGSAAKLLELLRIPGLNPAVARFSTIAVRNAPGLSRFSLGGLNEVASVVVGMYSVAAIRHVSEIRSKGPREHERSHRSELRHLTRKFRSTGQRSRDRTTSQSRPAPV